MYIGMRVRRVQRAFRPRQSRRDPEDVKLPTAAIV